MEVDRAVMDYGVKLSSFSKASVCEEDFQSDPAALKVVQDEDQDQDVSTQNMDGQRKTKVLHGRTGGLSSCLEGLVHIFKHIFSCQDADGDDDKDPLLEDPSPQGQPEVENGTTHLRDIQYQSTAERRERTTSVPGLFQAAIRRPRGPISPGLNPGSGPQHN